MSSPRLPVWRLLSMDTQNRAFRGRLLSSLAKSRRVVNRTDNLRWCLRVDSNIQTSPADYYLALHCVKSTLTGQLIESLNTYVLIDFLMLFRLIGDQTRATHMKWHPMCTHQIQLLLNFYVFVVSCLVAYSRIVAGVQRSSLWNRGNMSRFSLSYIINEI